MENAEPFIGIDPDDTQQVSIGGASVTIGAIDQGLWERISGEHELLGRAALRRVTKWLTENGEDPSEDVLDGKGQPLFIAGSRVNKASMLMTREPEYQERFHRLAIRAVKYAVKAHAGYLRRDLSPVPCELVDEVHDFGTVKALAPTTLRFYAANRDLLTILWNAIRGFQEVGPREKKVSLPPSSETSASSAAATVPSSPSSSS